MIDIDGIPEDVMLARGRYSTIRAAHEDEKKSLQILCGKLAATSAQILRKMQPDNGAPTEPADDLLAVCRQTLIQIEGVARNIESLAKLKEETKPIAWPK